MHFRIEYLSDGPRPHVLARQLEPGDFMVSKGSMLGAAGLIPPLSQPRLLKPDGGPDLSVFAFRLASMEDRAKLAVGQVVELVP